METPFTPHGSWKEPQAESAVNTDHLRSYTGSISVPGRLCARPALPRAPPCPRAWHPALSSGKRTEGKFLLGQQGGRLHAPPPCGFCRAAVFLSVSPWTHRALPHAMPLLGEACATRNELCRQKNKKCIVLCFIRRFPRWHD